MTKLLLLIGLPGSGKSTLAKQLLAECPQMQLISTDAIRGLAFRFRSDSGFMASDLAGNRAAISASYQQR